jgi:hypothetical protein
MSLSGPAVARLMKEVRAICAKPPEGIRVFVNEENVSAIVADIDGPGNNDADSPTARQRLHR